MKAAKQKLTLDRPATYQIRVPGHLDESWSDWAGGMTITVESRDDGPPTTTLTGAVDQAALPALLKCSPQLRVYAFASNLMPQHLSTYLLSQTPCALFGLVADYTCCYSTISKATPL